MARNFDHLVDVLAISPLSSNTLTTIASILEEQTLQSIPLFVSNSLQSLLTLESWAWQVLSEDFRRWIDEQSYSKLFHALYSFNIKLISNNDDILSEMKVKLLIPSNKQWIDGVLDQIETNNDTFLIVASLWFDNLSYLVNEQPDLIYSPTIIQINNRFSRDFVMTQRYKSYLQQLVEPTVSQSIFTKKLMFYLKTCSFSLNVFFWSKTQDFPFTAKEIIEFLGSDYSRMILVQSESLNSWSDELLSCIAHLTGFISATCWWGGQTSENIEMIIPPTDTTRSHILAFIRIVSHQPFHRYISVQWCHDENMLIYMTLILLVGAIETQDLGCFIGLKTNLPITLLTIAQTSTYDRLCVCAYGILATILTDAQLKELKIADNISKFFFDVLEKAWKHPAQKWKKIPILYLLKGFLSLSTNDAIQNATAHFKKISLFIELCDQYPIVYDIIWSLSFNPLIQEQLLSNHPFMAKLAKLELEMSQSNTARSVNGILWILNSNCKENEVLNKNNNTKFDIMISYSHKEKEICKQLYDELIGAGYRVWIDFDHMHGNVMDAMAQAIELSQIIIVCMSEQYQRSNYCRAEAQYAFKQKLKMIPILVQKYYKPDGWLSFLISHLLYIDFVKYDFPQAIEMLLKEVKLSHLQDHPSNLPERLNTNSANNLIQFSSLKQLPSQTRALPENVRDWTSSHVQQWLTDNNLPQMLCILSDTDGLSLIYFSDYIVNSESQQILPLLQQDLLRRTNETLSIVEVSRFRSLIERVGFAKLKPVNNSITTKQRSGWCQII